MFGELPRGKSRRKQSRPVEIGSPLWTADKAALIEEYIHRFLLVTKHGVYLDLFAGPQNDEEDWSIRRVLGRRTEGGPEIRHYAVCDLEPEKAEQLRELGRTHPGPAFNVYEGDANQLVQTMLEEAPIGSNTACFCLIDQRTLECAWSTVEAIARHKQNGGFKIEVFYFLAEAWLDRTWKSVKDPDKLLKWWGRPDYKAFLERPAFERAQALCARFRDDLGYLYSEPFAIHKKGKDSRIMYYMIHASDHPDAIRLMSDAYQKVPSNREINEVQLSLDEMGDGPPWR